jgi:hypothetical protein
VINTCRMFTFGVVVMLIFAAVDGQADPRPRTKTDEAEIVYAALASQPIAERKAIYRNLSAEMKAALWRAHFKHFLESHPELSVAQRGVIGQALELFTTDTFATPPDSRNWQSDVHEPMVRLEESARLLFDPQTARRAFALLGPDYATATGSEDVAAIHSDMSTRTARALPKAALRAGNTPECSCSQGSDWCFFSSCVGSICYMVTSSCGFGWQYDCTAACSN